MNTLSEARQDLVVALTEWRDAGGNASDVVAAIETLAREVAEDEIDSRDGGNR